MLGEIDAVLLKSRTKLMRLRNVVGVGIGHKVTHGIDTGELCLAVFVSVKMPPEKLKKKDIVPPEIDGVKTDVVETGEFYALGRTDRLRPCPPGMSIGHYRITAGTFGCAVYENETGTRLILSNNHVLANSNDATVGDAILQPGPIDGGRDAIGKLLRFVPIRFGDDPSNCPNARAAVVLLNAIYRLFQRRTRFLTMAIQPRQANTVDAAVASPNDSGDILDNIIDVGVPAGIREAILGMDVVKSGRTTGVTTGTVTFLNATLNVNYGGGRIAQFTNQILVGTAGFSAGGDSGSIIVTYEDETPFLVALLFAGSDTFTVGNKITHILDQLNVHVKGQELTTDEL